MDGTVLVVDDEPAIADGHASRLDDRFAVSTAYSGREALDVLGEDPVDVVLLDRRMPDLDGEEVLERIRARLDDQPRVAMVTGVEPSVDIVEMPFDDYLVKPVGRDELHETVDALLQRATYDEQLRRYFSLASKMAVLETEGDPEELAENSEYDRLEREIDRLKSTLDERIEELGSEGFTVAVDGNEVAD